jgi:hypothetical protein
VNATLEFLRLRKAAYQALGEMARKDLERFCRGTKSCFDADPRVHALLEGRREVWLRVEQHLELTPEQLAALYGAKDPETQNG